MGRCNSFKFDYFRIKTLKIEFNFKFKGVEFNFISNPPNVERIQNWKVRLNLSLFIGHNILLKFSLTLPE